jgi:integrase
MGPRRGYRDAKGRAPSTPLVRGGPGEEGDSRRALGDADPPGAGLRGPQESRASRGQHRSRTVDTLKAWRKVQVAERLTWGAAYRGAEDLVFTWDDGRPVLPDYVTKAFGTMTERLEGLPRLVLHELRHTHATVLLRDGVPVHIVAKRLGHRDPSVTLNVYADAIPDDDGRAVDVFARAVWGV